MSRIIWLWIGLLICMACFSLTASSFTAQSQIQNNVFTVAAFEPTEVIDNGQFSEQLRGWQNQNVSISQTNLETIGLRRNENMAVLSPSFLEGNAYLAQSVTHSHSVKYLSFWVKVSAEPPDINDVLFWVTLNDKVAFRIDSAMNLDLNWQLAWVPLPTNTQNVEIKFVAPVTEKAVTVFITDVSSNSSFVSQQPIWSPLLALKAQTSQTTTIAIPLSQSISTTEIGAFNPDLDLRLTTTSMPPTDQEWSSLPELEPLDGISEIGSGWLSSLTTGSELLVDIVSPQSGYLWARYRSPDGQQSLISKALSIEAPG